MTREDALKEAVASARRNQASIGVRKTLRNIFYTCATSAPLEGRHDTEVATVHCDGRIEYTV